MYSGTPANWQARNMRQARQCKIISSSKERQARNGSKAKQARPSWKAIKARMARKVILQSASRHEIICRQGDMRNPNAQKANMLRKSCAVEKACLSWKVGTDAGRQ